MLKSFLPKFAWSMGFIITPALCAFLSHWLLPGLDPEFPQMFAGFSFMALVGTVLSLLDYDTYWKL